jgi:hypothetical protein
MPAKGKHSPLPHRKEQAPLFINLATQPISHYLEQQVRLQLRKQETVLGVLGATAVIIGVVEEDRFISEGYRGDILGNMMRMTVFLISVFCCVLIVKRYKSLLFLNKVQSKLTRTDTLYSSKLYRGMLVELAVNLIHCPPGLDVTFDVEMQNFTMTYSVDTWICIVLLLRLYLVVRLFPVYSRFMQQRAALILRLHGQETSTSFAVKAFIHKSPMLSAMIVCMVFSVQCAVILLLLEQPDRHYSLHDAKLMGVDTVMESPLRHFWNCLWMVFVATTSVGYGDYYPYTHLGRAVLMWTCIVVKLTIGLLILALQDSLKHSKAQAASEVWIKLRENYRRLRQYAARVIVAFCSLSRLHARLCRNYPAGHMLSPFKVSRSNMPSLARILMPVVKVFTKNKRDTKVDQNLLKRSHFLKKQKLFLTMQLSYAKLKQGTKLRHFEQDQTQVLHSISSRQAIAFNDVSVKMHTTLSASTASHYQSFGRQTKILLHKAIGALKISERLLKEKLQPGAELVAESKQKSVQIREDPSDTPRFFYSVFMQRQESGMERKQKFETPFDGIIRRDSLESIDSEIMDDVPSILFRQDVNQLSFKAPHMHMPPIKAPSTSTVFDLAVPSIIETATHMTELDEALKRETSMVNAANDQPQVSEPQARTVKRPLRSLKPQPASQKPISSRFQPLRAQQAFGDPTTTPEVLKNYISSKLVTLRDRLKN